MTYNRVRAIARKEARVVEKKDTQLNIYNLQDAGASVTAAGTIYALSGAISKGDDENNRQGDEILLKSIFIRFDVTHDDSTNVFRLILFRWMGEGVPTSSGNLLEDTITVPWLSPLSRQYAKYIQVIYDKSYAISTNTDANIVGKIYKMLKGKANWTSSGGRVKGQLYLFAISDSAIGGPNFKWSSRLRYVA